MIFLKHKADVLLLCLNTSRSFPGPPKFLLGWPCCPLADLAAATRTCLQFPEALCSLPFALVTPLSGEPFTLQIMLRFLKATLSVKSFIIHHPRKDRHVILKGGKWGGAGGGGDRNCNGNAICIGSES